ncbi:hypothetical protein [Streptomyces sp. R35]|uniref:Uncharacterized protein n=1 Tax=Streptomyces sp. R35 TaxID=3238630 RepID=A0AB39S230_9ACTN
MRKAQDVHDELRAGLREAAEAYEPDRARILARVERGMAGADERRPSRRAARPPLLGWARVVGATAAVASVLAVGGYAVASAVKDDTPAQQTVAVSPTPDPSPDATSRAPVDPDPTHRSGTSEQSGKPSSSPSGSPTPENSTSATAQPPATGGTEDGPLWSDGSVDPHSNEFWAQSNVTLKNSKQLTSLTVELKIRQTGGVTNAGAWRSLPEDDFTTTVVEKDGFLVYTWVLKPDHTVWGGEWVFAGQYDHDRGGRDAKDDSYSMTATDTDGKQSAVKGGFAAQDSGETASGGDS